MYNLKTTDYDKFYYENELKNFLPDKFIDFHVHIWKSDMPLAGKSNGGSTWTHLVADEMTAEDMYNTFNTLFPNQEVTPLVFGGVDQNVDAVNDYVVQEKKKFDFPALLRTDYIMTGEELEEQVKKGGFIGLKPYLTFCPPYIPASEIRIFDYLPEEHLKTADKNGWIVMLHIPRSKRLKDEVNLAQIMEIEEKYPNLKLVVAHVGRAYSKQDLGDAFDLLKNTKNMYFDFTANVCDDAIKACIEAVGTKRLIFGSDLPISIMRMYRTIDENGFYYNNVPAGLYGDTFDDPHMKISPKEDITLMIYEQIAALKRVAVDMKLTDAQVEEIMYTNAKQLIDSFN